MTLRDQLEPPLRAAGVKPTCAAAGVPYPTVFRWLRGAGNLTDRHVEALAGVLGLKIRVSRRRRGFTLIELLVVVAVVAVLVSLLIPGLAGVRARARAVACAANLRSQVQAVAIYRDQNRGHWPATWEAVLDVRVGDPSGDARALRCPADRSGTVSYVLLEPWEGQTYATFGSAVDAERPGSVAVSRDLMPRHQGRRLAGYLPDGSVR